MDIGGLLGNVLPFRHFLGGGHLLYSYLVKYTSR